MLLKHILGPARETVFMYKAVKSYKLAHITNRDPNLYKDLLNDDVIKKYLKKVRTKQRVDLNIGETLSLDDAASGFKDGEAVDFKTLKSYNEHAKQGYATIIKDIGRFGDEGHELHELLKDIDRAFESNFSLWCNIYSSNKRKALEPHTDSDSIIVLQYEGQRVWNFFGAARDWKTDEPVEYVTMSAGDFLYFPKWTPHVAADVNARSSHATIQIPTKLDQMATCPDDWECQPSSEDRDSSRDH